MFVPLLRDVFTQVALADGACILMLASCIPFARRCPPTRLVGPGTGAEEAPPPPGAVISPFRWPE